MTSTEMYRALRPSGPRKTARVLRTLFVCACVAWLGWCALEMVRACATAFASAACVQQGNAWTDGVCVAPVIELHVDGPSKPKNPLAGPGGA
jgi:hypothetical protein